MLSAHGPADGAYELIDLVVRVVEREGRPHVPVTPKRSIVGCARRGPARTAQS
jgi:hypothetical protein